MRGQPERIESTICGADREQGIVRKCLEDVKMLHQDRCILQGKWTLSHIVIPLNEQTDNLANKGCKQPLSQGARTPAT